MPHGWNEREWIIAWDISYLSCCVLVRLPYPSAYTHTVLRSQSVPINRSSPIMKPGGMSGSKSLTVLLKAAEGKTHRSDPWLLLCMCQWKLQSRLAAQCGLCERTSQWIMLHVNAWEKVYYLNFAPWVKMSAFGIKILACSHFRIRCRPAANHLPHELRRERPRRTPSSVTH